MFDGETAHENIGALSKASVNITPFSLTLSRENLKLNRDKTHTLQVNLGFLCNQTCRHCHLDAGPMRRENMASGIVDEVISYARRGCFETIDITGGAPELNPNVERLIEEMVPLAPKELTPAILGPSPDGQSLNCLGTSRARPSQSIFGLGL